MSYHPSFEKHLKDSLVNAVPTIQLKPIKLPEKSWIPKIFHNSVVLQDKDTNTLYDLQSVKIGRPKKIAMYNKKEKAFMKLS